MRLKVLRDHGQPLSANPEGGCRSRPTSDEGHLGGSPRSLRCNRVHGQNDLTRFGLPAKPTVGHRRSDEAGPRPRDFRLQSPLSFNVSQCPDLRRCNSFDLRTIPLPCANAQGGGSSPNGKNRPAAGEVRSRFVYRTTRTNPRERAPDASSEELDEAQ